LDTTVSRESRLLRRDLLNLIGVREFSDEANFTNPCETFCLQQVICDFCNHCQDLDLTREENAEIDEDEELDLQRKNCWSCPSCHTLYDKTGIEQKLVNIVRKRLLTWQVQDIKCERCKLVRAEEILGNCAECTGKLVTEIDKSLFQRRMKVFQNIAEFYEMNLLKEVVGWAVSFMQ
jgi:DNA polymerase epsilon subunit 1